MKVSLSPHIKFLVKMQKRVQTSVNSSESSTEASLFIFAQFVRTLKYNAQVWISLQSNNIRMKKGNKSIVLLFEPADC